MTRMNTQKRAADGLAIRYIVAQALEGIERHTLPEAVREDYLSSYAGDRFVESAAYVRSYPSDLPVRAERLSDIRTPVQIIAGRRDTLVPPRTLNSCTRGCQAASSTSSRPATSRGRTALMTI